MKRLFLSITLLLVVFISNGQTTAELDNRYGFKNIKLDDLKSKFSPNLTFWKSITADNVTGYHYKPTDNSLFFVFDLKMDAINLFFDNTTNKLVKISLEKKYSASNNSDHYSTALADNSKLIDYFIGLFGKITSVIDNEENADLGAGWVGNKVMLKTITAYGGITEDSYIVISVSKLSFFKEKLKSGF